MRLINKFGLIDKKIHVTYLKFFVSLPTAK